jgi:hypothetical protein
VPEDSAEYLAHKDFNMLLQTFLSARVALLKNHDTLIPMAMALDDGGEPRFVALKPTNESTYTTDEHVRAYKEMLAFQYNNSDAVLLGYDITLKNGGEFSDAVCCELTHQTGVYVKVALPFNKDPKSKHVTTGELVQLS